MKSLLKRFTKLFKLLVLLIVVASFLNACGFIHTHKRTVSSDITSLSIRGTNYSWADSILSTTAEIDCLWNGTNEAWDFFTAHTDTAAFWYKVAHNKADTTNWASRDWSKGTSSDVIGFGPSTPVYRFTWKIDAGSDYMYLSGTKKKVQPQS